MACNHYYFLFKNSFVDNETINNIGQNCKLDSVPPQKTISPPLQFFFFFFKIKKWILKLEASL